jgi:Protein of unknown function (DUF1328)
MLHWAIIFLVVALVAAVLGFGGVAGTAMVAVDHTRITRLGQDAKPEAGFDQRFG